MNADITGMITASIATHILPHIEYPIGWDDVIGEPFVNVGHTEDYKYLGEVINTPGEAINNGVIVSLDGDSSWTVTGTCYLTSLLLAEGAVVNAPMGKSVSMTVEGAPQSIVPGTYTGAIVLEVN